MTDHKKTNVTAESVEVQKAKVTVPGIDALYGMIKTTFSLPPYRPDLRVYVRPFIKDNRSRDPIVFILHSQNSAKLLSTVLRKTAEQIENYADLLPDKEL